jgi:hypothetical protein
MALEVKTAKNSKLPKLPENCFEPVGKGGWPLISTWIRDISMEKEWHIFEVSNLWSWDKNLGYQTYDFGSFVQGLDAEDLRKLLQLHL